MDTGSRKWGSPYLTRKFFSLIGESMSRDVLLVMATQRPLYRRRHQFHRLGHPVRPQLGRGRASSLPAFRGLLLSGDHFAIQRGLRIVEAGAQGEHKLARGYLPQTTHSAIHRRPRSAPAIADYLKRERAYVAEVGRELAESGPFRKGCRRGGLTLPVETT